METATIESQTEDCLVKLVYGCYVAEAYRLPARDDLAPDLFGIRVVEGTPTAVAMEYLKRISLAREVGLHHFFGQKDTGAAPAEASGNGGARD